MCNFIENRKNLMVFENKNKEIKRKKCRIFFSLANN